MPGCQGRMSGTPPLRRPGRRSHSSLTACPGPWLADHRGWRMRDAPSARAASLASSAALAVPAAGQPSPRPESLRWTLRGTLRWTLRGYPRTPRRLGALFPLGMPPSGGMERPGRVDALRAIDSSARPRSWRTCGPRRLRRHQSCPGSHAAWRRTTKAAATPGDGRAISWRSSRLSRPMPGHGVASGSCRCLRWP